MNNTLFKLLVVIGIATSLTACGEKHTAQQYGQCTGATAAVVMYNKDVGPGVKEFFYKNPNGQARFAAINESLAAVLGPNYTPGQVQQYFARAGGTPDQEDYLDGFWTVYNRGKAAGTNSVRGAMERESAVMSYCDGMLK